MPPFWIKCPVPFSFSHHLPNLLEKLSAKNDANSCRGALPSERNKCHVLNLCKISNGRSDNNIERFLCSLVKQVNKVVKVNKLWISVGFFFFDRIQMNPKKSIRETWKRETKRFLTRIVHSSSHPAAVWRMQIKAASSLLTVNLISEKLFPIPAPPRRQLANFSRGESQSVTTELLHLRKAGEMWGKPSAMLSSRRASSALCHRCTSHPQLLVPVLSSPSSSLFPGDKWYLRPPETPVTPPPSLTVLVFSPLLSNLPCIFSNIPPRRLIPSSPPSRFRSR